VQLDDGTRIQIRPISPADRGQLAAGFERLSPESRYRRFFTPIARLGDSELDYLTRVDHRDHEALVALEESSGEGIAVARFVRLDEHAAEPAIVVADDWQGRGVASHLLAALADRAREEGISKFVAPVLAENPESIAVFERLGDTVSERMGLEVELTIDLTEPVRARSDLEDILRAVASGLLTPAHMLWELVWRRLPRATGIDQAIVVGTDGTDDAAFAVDCAGELARSLGGTVHVVSARRPLLDDPSVIEGHLRAAEQSLKARGIGVAVHSRRGDPALAILYVALRERAGLIVLGSAHGGGTTARLPRSVWDSVAHHAQCSVLIARRGLADLPDRSGP
jgi:nucleotide-binding universal stress UspA family protein/RimJ/RimL family protein N-acetyltransferase